jgi:hypothetical protein
MGRTTPKFLSFSQTNADLIRPVSRFYAKITFLKNGGKSLVTVSFSENKSHAEYTIQRNNSTCDTWVMFSAGTLVGLVLAKPA